MISHAIDKFLKSNEEEARFYVEMGDKPNRNLPWKFFIFRFFLAREKGPVYNKNTL